jgi:hypothetical protein
LQLLGEFELVIFKEKDFVGIKNIPNRTEGRILIEKLGLILIDSIQSVKSRQEFYHTKQ